MIAIPRVVGRTLALARPSNFAFRETGITMTKVYVQTVGRMAYLWGWTLVTIANRRADYAKVPAPGLVGGSADRAQRDKTSSLTLAGQRFHWPAYAEHRQDSGAWTRRVLAGAPPVLANEILDVGDLCRPHRKPLRRRRSL